MPHIVPIEGKKEFEQIAAWCNKTKEPVFFTKEGKGVLAMLDMESYDKIVKKKLKCAETEMDGVDLLISLYKSLED